MTTATSNTRDELQRVMNDIMLEAIKPNVAAIDRITRDGDVAIVFYQVDESRSSVRTLAAALRRSSASAVVRLTRTRAAALFAREPNVHSWLGTRVRGQSKIMLLARGAYLPVNYTKARGFWLNDLTMPGDELLALVTPST